MITPIGPETGLHDRAVKEIKGSLEDAGVAGGKLGVALAETGSSWALREAGSNPSRSRSVPLRGVEVANEF